MREARIQCYRDYPIHDLALNLRVGDVLYVDAERARASADLREAIRLKVVRVQYVVRAKVFKPPAPRPPPPPNVRLARRRPAVATTDSTSAPGMDLEAVKQAASEAASAAVQESMAEIKALLAASPRGFAPQTTTTTAVAAADDVEPVFIPMNIVDKTAGIQVTPTEAGDTDGLEVASAALKSTRRGRPKKE